MSMQLCSHVAKKEFIQQKHNLGGGGGGGGEGGLIRE